MNISAAAPRIAPKGYQPSPHQAEFTESGKLLADLSADSYDSAGGTWEGVRKLAADGLRKVRDNGDTSADEKSIAQLGLQIGGRYLYNNDAAKMQRSVLGTLAAAVPGPMGQVLAQTTLSAYASTTNSFTWEQARGVAADGLRAVQSNEGTSQSEKDLASLGLKFADGYQYNDEAASMQKEILKTLAQGTEGDMPQVLADATLDVRGSVSFRKWETVRQLETRGLGSIRDHADADDYDKTIANLGINFGDEYMYNDDVGKIQKAVLEALREPGEGNIPYEISRVTKKAYNKGIRYSASRKIMKEAFETILAREDASDTQKTIAQMGLDVGSDRMTDQEASDRRVKILNKLIDLG
jgi:hypothetical protein